MLNFKIVLLEASEVETDPPMTDRRKIIQTDGQKIVQIDGHYIGIWCDTFQTKKDF